MAKLFSIIILVFVSYYPAINGEFIWDDDTFLTNNPIMDKPDALKRFWASTEPPDYFPLVSTSLWLQRLFWGHNPMGYHIVNIVLHFFNAVLLWRILYKLNLQGAWIAAAIFALHPVHVESVAWITEIKNLQSTFFFMLTIICYLNFANPVKERLVDGSLKSRRIFGLLQGLLSTSLVAFFNGVNKQKKQWYFFSLLFFLMALLSKTSVVMLPLILLLYHWWKDGTIKKKILANGIPFFLLSAIFSWITIWFQYNRAGAVGEPWSIEFLERVAIAGRAVWFYLGKLIFPYDLMFIYPRWSMGAGQLISYLPVIALIIVSLVLWNKRKVWGRPLLAGLGYFVINLFPVLGFFNIYFMRYSFVSDHWQYLASPGVIVLGVWIINSYSNHFSGIALLKKTIGFLLLGFLAFSTFHRAEIFQKNFTIWEDTLKKNPSAWMAHNNMGIELEKQGKQEMALEHYQKAIEINPHYAISHDNFGLILQRKGRFKEAVVHFKQAIKEDPKFWESFNNLGYVLNKLGKTDEAITYFQHALEVNPYSAEAHNNLANILDAKGKIEEAAMHYKKALSINPKNAEIHNNLGALLLSDRQHLKEAINHFQKAVQINPALKKARQNLAIALKKYRESI